jgi:dimethylargininase
MTAGLSAADLGLPDHELALQQHDKYIDALRQCGLDVEILPADENFPDSTFVEDTALMTPKVAVITNPGAPSRKGEVQSMHDVIKKYDEEIAFIRPPGTLEAGDVMMAGDHYFIGLSERTNQDGAEQLIRILKNHGMGGSIIEISEILHLKSGISYLENNNMLAVDTLIDHPALKNYKIIHVPYEEAYAANSLWINDRVLVPAEFPDTLRNIREAGYDTLTLDMSEFRKLDGGLSCLSLRF